MDKHKEALKKIEIIQAENAWLDCMCAREKICKLCQIKNIVKKALEE